MTEEPLSRNRVALAVTGSIAAFKAAKLASDLVRDGFEVRVLLTRGATRFIMPLTFEAITGNPVAVEVWDEQPGSSRMGHIELGQWAELLVVAPATADAIARLAHGLADDMLGAVALTTSAPLLVAPAMETAMFYHPATETNLDTLRGRGAQVIGPDSGRLASGAEGAGRMSEPEVILEEVRRALSGGDMCGNRVLITAGPTYEPIDPVRFLGNRSSGKMGFALAKDAAARGANVTLVSGPSSLPDPRGTTVIRVETAEQMRRAVVNRADGMDAVVMAAAVADFRPVSFSEGKIKRSDSLHLDLEPTGDIAAEAARIAPNAIHVGFALESDDLTTSARNKLTSKGLDLVVANAISDSHIPFGNDNNRVVLVDSAGETELPEMSKQEVARIIWDRVVRLRNARLARGT